jgi:predicted phosphate transport protein (TIGR00153 family)
VVNNGIVLAAHKMFTWLDLRRKSKTLSLARKEIVLAIKTVTELREAIKAVAEGKRGEMEKHLQTLFSDEIEVDDLRRLVFEDLARESLPAEYREDLMHIVKRLDVMADYVKDSARNIKILQDTVIPAEIWNEVVKIAEILVKEADLLGSTIGTLGIAPPQVRDLAEKVDEQEHIVDNYQLKVRALIFGNKRFSFAAKLFLRDLLNCLEEIADTCADVADYVRVLAVGY